MDVDGESANDKYRKSTNVFLEQEVDTVQKRSQVYDRKQKHAGVESGVDREFVGEVVGYSFADAF